MMIEINSYKLSEICDIQIGRTPRRKNKKYWGKGHTWVTISDLSDDKYISESKEEITDVGIEECGCKLIPKGTVIFSFKLSIGKRAIAEKDLYTNEAIAAFKIIDEERVNAEYLYYVLDRVRIVGMNNAAMGKTLNTKSLRNIRVPVPESITDQRRIVLVLEKIESLVNYRKESIDLADQFLNMKFLEIFGDPVRNSKNWQTDKLQNLGELNRGVSKHRPRNAPELLSGPYPLIQTGEVSNADLYIKDYSQTYSELGLEQSKLWPKGTLCITIAANIAKTGILSFDACFPDSVVGFTTERIETSIFVHFLMSFLQEILETNARQVAQKNINLGILRNLEVIKPDIEYQVRFYRIVEQVEKLKVYYQESLEELNNLYGSLSQRAFKGELDLSNIQIEKEDVELERNIDNLPEVTAEIIEKGRHEPKEKVLKDVKEPFLETSEHLNDLIFENNFDKTHFTFEDVKNLVNGLDWDYEYEKLKELVFELVRKEKLKQVFVDASYKSEFDSAGEKMAEELPELEEKIYFRKDA